ncbi:hypothetical protein CDAR_556801 [Caerostris darwini]|uniref:Uncharacterized protein n=1 Tax=Caerostris darwini TaxID=1538125 RepID=A0AAV4RFW7_9ARAC|nr:hypothetical protein CDAR_556801 [Caerostris darwini]
MPNHLLFQQSQYRSYCHIRITIRSLCLYPPTVRCNDRHFPKLPLGQSFFPSETRLFFPLLTTNVPLFPSEPLPFGPSLPPNALPLPKRHSTHLKLLQYADLKITPQKVLKRAKAEKM